MGLQWNKANKPKMAAAYRKWAAAHPEKVKELQRKKYLACREKLLEKRKAYVLANQDENKSYQRSYAKSEHGRLVRNNAEHRRRARIKQTEDAVTNAEVKELIAQSTNCAYCDGGFDLLRRRTLDHVTPLSKGGVHKLSNLAIACGPCNSRKGSKLNLKEFT